MIRNINTIMLCGVRALSIDFIGRPLCVRFCATHASQARPFARQPQSDCITDSPACSGYDRNLIVESHPKVFILIKT